MRRLMPAALTLLLLFATTAAADAASPRDLPGWPHNAPVGQLFPGPKGGVVVVSVGVARTTEVAAYRRDGRQLWFVRRGSPCGMCAPNQQPTTRRADGTYGPIDSDYWAVGPRGRRAVTCAGLMLTDRACVQAPESPGVGPTVGVWDDGYVSTLATPGVRRLWSVTDRRFGWRGEDGARPTIVKGSGDLVFAAFSSPTTAGGAPGPPGVLLAVDTRRHAIAWTRVGPIRVLAGLGAGVLVKEDNGIVALDSDGTVRWSRSVPAGLTVLTDPDRVFVDSGPPEQVVRVLSARTGAPLWRTRARDRATLRSLGAHGRAYLAINAPGRAGAVAVRSSTGARLWERRSRLTVSSVRELADGTVAISSGPGVSGGVLTIVDPS